MSADEDDTDATVEIEQPQPIDAVELEVRPLGGGDVTLDEPVED